MATNHPSQNSSMDNKLAREQQKNTKLAEELKKNLQRRKQAHVPAVTNEPIQ
jgi:hypothetical protein